MVVREVPLDAAGNPCSEHTDERGLHDVLTVERFEAGLLVCEVEQVTAVFREESHLEPVILQRQVLVGLVELGVMQDILHWVRINASLCALIDTARVKERCLVISSRCVGRQYNLAFGSGDVTAVRECGGNCRRDKKENGFIHGISIYPNTKKKVLD